jgi:hypothetical protein
LAGVYGQAVDIWSATPGVAWHQQAILQSVDVQISDLPGARLGQAFGSTITLDVNAAGWGWFVDPTPWDDNEFVSEGDSGLLTADNDSTAEGRIDLLTAVMHELGHVLGERHGEDGVMQATLELGTRRLPEANSGFTPAMVDRVFAG